MHTEFPALYATACQMGARPAVNSYPEPMFASVLRRFTYAVLEQAEAQCNALTEAERFTLAQGSDQDCEPLPPSIAGTVLDALYEAW